MAGFVYSYAAVNSVWLTHWLKEHHSSVLLLFIVVNIL